MKWHRSRKSAAPTKSGKKIQTETLPDLRTMEEREIVPDNIDDRLGALFIANDYSIAPFLAKIKSGDGENIYKGIEETIAPQLRSMFRRVLAEDGAVVYHCSAGQDRTGIADGTDI